MLGISENDGMVNMFRALEATGLRGFLGCPSVLYEQELEQFFDTAMVQDGDITCAVSRKYVVISEDRFLMMTAIHFGVKINWSKILFEVLKEMADRTIKRAKGFVAQICVLLKGDPSVTLGEAKTFPSLKILSTKTVNTYVATNKTIESRGETNEPDVDKVAIVKRKSVSKKKSAPTDKKDADEELVEVVEKAVPKKRSASTGDEPAVTKKKRTTKKKTTLLKANLELVSIATEATPVQMVEPISFVNHPTRTGSDYDNAEKEPAVKEIFEKEHEASTADDVDQIIALIVTDTAEMETEEMFEETDVGKSDETAEATGTDVVMGKTDIEEPVVQRSDETTTEESAQAGKEIETDAVSISKDITVEIYERSTDVTDEELMYIDDLLQQILGDAFLPSVLAAEPTRIKFSNGISIPGVADGDLYKASLPKIAVADKGKAPPC
ncbi:hypothetical protein F511_44456 [Dorcoceras hygrometricum]|uniref:Splicing factor 3B subunit 1-like n=1 Tax=Dorcoceras hygrometricum TaxID=472368 RepID=A0A2Z6ZXZ4_9LAMI|nr:hypothetical protein F511_44456 [Dorcoceras hygrometricum]